MSHDMKAVYTLISSALWCREYTRRWKETLQKLNNFQAEKQTNTLDPDEKTGDQLSMYICAVCMSYDIIFIVCWCSWVYLHVFCSQKQAYMCMSCRCVYLCVFV